MRHPNLRLNAIAAAALAALAILGFIVPSALGAASVRVNINLGGPGVEWRQRPSTVMLPGTRVSWVREYSDADVYQSGSSWYCYRGGNWYRSRNYRGPWGGVSVNLVPREISYAPANYHHFDHGNGMNGRRDQGQRPGNSGDNRDNRNYRGNGGNRGNQGNGGPGNSNHGGPGR
jgi:hypothetical protein